MLTLIAAVAFTLCPTGGGVNCVVDGDTIWLRGEKIRILNIDAPETHQPKCPSERALGNRATDRLFQLIDGKRIVLVRDGRDKDRNGRLLRRVEANGNAEYALFADLTGSNPAPRWFGHQFRERDFTFA